MIALILFCKLNNAQVPILYYDFENNTTRSGFENLVEQAITTGSGPLTKAGSTTTISGVAGAGIFNGGSVTGEAISGSSWSSSTTDLGISAPDYFQFSVNTSGFKGISVSFDNQASATGPARAGVLYSTDGSTFNVASFSPILTGNNSFAASGKILFPSAVDNQVNVIIRIYPYAGSAADRTSRSNFSSGGTFRIDNLMVSASEITANNTLLNNPGIGISIKSGTVFTPTYANLTISNSAQVTTSAINLSGSLTVGKGSIFIIGGGTFTSGGTININGSFQINNSGNASGGTWVYGPDGVIQYNSGGTYFVGNEWTGNSVSAGPGVPALVIIQNNTSLSLPASDRGAGSMDIETGALILNPSAGDLYLSGNWNKTIGGTFTHNGRNVIFNGTRTNFITAPGDEQFSSLIIDKPNGGITLNTNTDIQINTTLGLKNGVINTNSNKVIVTNTNAAAINRTSGYINGNLQRAVASGNSSYLFPIGDINSYSPVTIDFSNASAGNLLAATTAGDNPNTGTSTLDANRSVNRYWTLTDIGNNFTSATYDATFEFVTGDVDPGVNNNSLKIGKYDGANWTYPPTIALDALHEKVTGVS
ncbi:MAG: hypothetical protein ACHQF0_09340, partial [Chitinophagales bacterium]